MQPWLKHSILFIIGGCIYLSIEIIYRWLVNSTPTHIAMFFIGGILFLLIGWLNEFYSWNLSFVLQDIIGTGLVLLVEFIAGIILNLQFNLHIWDYSNIPGNILGQVCAPFAVCWIFLVAFAIILDDYLRYWLFHEEKPHYRFF